jgi:dihydrofolate reductase
MQITIIAAVSDDGIIGQAGGIPWHLPREVAHFRAYCAGKWLLVGRGTFDEMKGWFRDHHPVVLSRNEAYTPLGAQRASTIADALHLATEAGAGEIVVIGGGQIYALALPVAHQLILTQVHTTLRHGVPFPAWPLSDWRLMQQQTFPADETHAYAYTISTYHKLTL